KFAKSDLGGASFYLKTSHKLNNNKGLPVNF
ncbi:hypothetical protein BOH78_2576, partial [Pichia kudriavzevii]